MAMALYYYGLRDTTATYSANFLNLIPIVTFIFAVIFRLERLGLRSRAGKLKILGTLLCVGGTLVMSLYKGKALDIWPSHMVRHQRLANDTSKHNWLRGTMFLLGSCFSYAFWFIAQAKLSVVYPSKYWATFFTCLIGCCQSLILGIAIEQKMDAWRLKWNLQLVTIVYSGTLNTGATFCILSWVITQRGPTYPPMFNTLSVIFTTILESLYMGQDITIGSLLGMLMIVGGLYAFLWGKRKEISQQKLRVGDLPLSPEAGNSQPVLYSSPISSKGEQSPHVVNITNNHSKENVMNKT